MHGVWYVQLQYRFKPVFETFEFANVIFGQNVFFARTVLGFSCSSNFVLAPIMLEAKAGVKIGKID
jgi:hypothetical protein